MSIISLKDVWLKYRIEFKENGKLVPEDFWALKGINMDINKGEVVGIIGENGAGKTTILKIMAGMLKPDKGSVEINGTVSALMEIGAGFQKDLTGKENIYLVFSLFGLTKEQMDERYEDVVNFAEIGRFINAPVKIYSGGMYMRLAFAIAIYVETDILMVDDIFAVGDIYAQRKCVNKMFELREKGKTIIFVSHDVEMVKRLCSKGLFVREGMIIKDGPMDVVCSYYAETVGSKKGIAIVQKGALAIVFNNGRTILRWKDRTFTCNLAGHSIIFSLGREFLSTTADWEIQEPKTKDSIIAIGKWADFPISQYVKIIFVNEKEFILEIKLNTLEDNIIEKVRTSFIFIDEYKKWFTLAQEFEFPETFINALDWESFAINSSLGRIVGLMNDSRISESVPTIIFDRLNDNVDAICQVSNTGFEVKGRAITYEYHIGNMKNNHLQNTCRYFISRIRLFENKEQEQLQQYIGRAKQIIQESVIIRKNLLSIFCKDHKIEVYYQDKLLTSGIGLDARFRCQDKNYSALDGLWVIHKQNEEEIIITISWDEGSPFSQTWRLKLQDNDIILWEIEIETDEKIRLRNKEVELVLNEEYEKWITADEKGDFRRLDKKGNTVLLDKYINEHIGVEGLYKADGLVLPGVVFNYKDAVPKASYISKIKEGVKATRLWYVEIDSRDNFYVSSGRYKYFKGEIRVVAGQEENPGIAGSVDKKAAIRDTALLNKIEFDSMSLVFDNGKGRLFWKGIELTKGLGLCSSVFLKGVWYDSSQAFWEVQKLDQKRLTAVSYWPWLPLIQTWKICLADENTVIWEIEKEIWDNVILEREQVSLMLSHHYQEWSVNKQVRGKFPEAFSEPNGIFWDRLWCGDITSSIRVEQRMVGKKFLVKQFLPAVTFDCSVDCQARYFIIENTDNLFEARALQYEFNSNQKCSVNKDRDKYFEGRIKINI